MASKSSDKRKTTAKADAAEPTSTWGSAMPNHNIWLAGLGALAQAQADAQAEGRKAFETLVKQGVQMQAQSQELATQQWAEAAERLGAMTTQVAGSSQSWNRLGSIFETRVQRALTSMGAPTANDWAQLDARIEKLEKTVAALAKAQKPAARKAAAAATKPKSTKKSKP